MAIAPQVTTEPIPTADYARLEERIIARDQLGASQALYGLMKQGRPITEITRETVRIHAPYTTRPLSPAPRRRRGEVRQQRPLSLERAGRPAAAHDGPARAGLAADGADRLVHADRSRPVEPAARQGARPLHAALRAPRWTGPAEAADALARSGAASDRRPHPRASEPLAHARAARRGAARATACSSASCRTRANRKSVLAHLASPGSSTCRTGCCTTAPTPPATNLIGARAAIELGNAIGWDNAHSVLYAERARHRGRPALVLDVRDGLQRRPEPPRTARTPSCSGKTARCTPAEGGAAGRRHHAPARGLGRSRRWWRCCAAVRKPAADSRRDPGRGRAGHPRDGCAEQLLPCRSTAAVLQHAGVVLQTPSSTRIGSSSCSSPRRSSTTAPSTSATRPTTGRARSRCRPASRGSARASCWSGSRRRRSRCSQTKPSILTAAYLKAGFDRAPLVRNAGHRRVQDRQRSAQSGARPLHARELPQLPGA